MVLDPHLRPFTAHPSRVCRPLFYSPVAAGFPSPAEDHVDAEMDLNEYLIRRPAATFFARARGDSMIGAGIHDGDMLIIDRGERPRSGSIVVAVVHGEMTVKRLRHHNGHVMLEAANPDYRPIEIEDPEDLMIWGTVKHVIHPV